MGGAMEGSRGKKWRVEHRDALQRGSASIRSGEALKAAGLDALKRENLSPHHGACPIEGPFRTCGTPITIIPSPSGPSSECRCEFVRVVSHNPKWRQNWLSLKLLSSLEMLCRQASFEDSALVSLPAWLAALLPIIHTHTSHPEEEAALAAVLCSESLAAGQNGDRRKGGSLR